AEQIHRLPDAYETAEMVSTTRWNRQEQDWFNSWHGRIWDAQSGDAGEWSVRMPDGKSYAQGEDGWMQNVQNYPHDALRDHRRVVSESLASVTAKPRGNSDAARKAAAVNAAIAMGYWTAYDELMVPELVMDLELAGAAFVHVWADPARGDQPMADRL